MSVSFLRKEFRKFIEPFVDDISKYSMHSMSSDAASNPACRRISGDLLDIYVLGGDVLPPKTDTYSILLRIFNQF